MILLLIFFYVGIFLWQGPSLFRKKSRRDFWAFLFFWSLALSFNALQVLGVKLFNPFQAIRFFFEAVIHLD